MSLVSLTGMLVYSFEISNEFRANWGSIRVSCSLWIRSLVLPRVYVLGSGVIVLIVCVNNRASL
jgi:hypothetical protein